MGNCVRNCVRGRNYLDYDMTPERRALHYVLKIGNRKAAIDFLKNVLGMKVLRHEEFEQGCEATCNGPYDGKWSKTMVGYGAEDNHFVLELTYNYGISEYRHGNDFGAIEIMKKDVSSVVAAGAKLQKLPGTSKEAYVMETNGYRFNIIEDKSTPVANRISRVILYSTNLARTLNFYGLVLGMVKSRNELFYPDNDSVIEFKSLEEGVVLDRGQAFGRIAFSCPTEQLKTIEATATESTYGEKVQTPYVTLSTPGKADVHVVILSDPDGHEICFVGDEGFRDLSKVDPDGDKLLEEAIAADKSDEWFAKKGREKGKQLG